MFEIMNKKIDLLLATNKLTSQKLANNIDIEIETLNNKLAGTEAWHALDIIKIAKFFNVTLVELVNDNYSMLRLKM